MGCIMQAKLIVGLIIAILVIIFTIQNQVSLDINFFFWTFNLPLSITIFFSLLLGVLITFCIGLGGRLKLNRELKAKSDKISELKHRVETGHME